MLLTECPQCGFRAQSFDDACPKCGYPIAANPRGEFNIFRLLATNDNNVIRMGIASNPEACPETLASLAEDNNPLVRFCAAKNVSTPPASLAKLALEDSSKKIKKRALANPSIDPDVLATVALCREAEANVICPTCHPSHNAVRPSEYKEPDWESLEKVAKNPSTPADALAKLAQSENKRIREAIANNPSTPPSILQALALRENESDWIKHCAAKNPAMPVAVLINLATKGDALVRSGVAENPVTPSKTIARLSEDEDSLIWGRAINNPAMPPDKLSEFAKDNRDSIRVMVARNASTPPAALAELAFDQHPGIQTAVASNPSTPSEILAALADANSPHYCRQAVLALANNSSTPPETLASFVESRKAFASFAEDVDEALFNADEMMDKAKRFWSFQADIASNPSTPPEALSRLAKPDFVGPTIVPDIWSNETSVPGWICEGVRKIRDGIARNPGAPPELLSWLATDIGPSHSKSVSSNPSASPVFLASEIKSAIERYSEEGIRASQNSSTNIQPGFDDQAGSWGEEDEPIDKFPFDDINSYFQYGHDGWYYQSAFNAASNPALAKLNSTEYRGVVTSLASAIASH